MDITNLVMAAGAKYEVYATGATTYPGPFPAATLSAVGFPDVEQALTFEAACMGDGIPAKYYGVIDEEPTVLVMH